MLVVSGVLAGAWALVAPWLGPVVFGVIPLWARLRARIGGLGDVAAPLAGLTIVAISIGFGAWMIHDRREALRAEGEARCAAQIAEVTIEQLRAEQERRQRAELAANAAREEAQAVETAFSAKVADLERELIERPPRGLCYPADIARKLNQ